LGTPNSVQNPTCGVTMEEGVGVVAGRHLMRLEPAFVTAAAIAAVLLLASCGQDGAGEQGGDPVSASVPQVVTSGQCEGEEALVRRALDRSGVDVDIDGDGRLDRVAVASDPGADEPCRGFVGVRIRGGSTYSTHLFARAVPFEGLPARIDGLPDLGDEPGAAIVVDTRAAVDAVLGQMFTLAGGRLQPAEVPGSEDGIFIVEGGGVIYPHGAGCTADGRLVLTEAAQTRDGEAYRVTRRTHEAYGDPLRFGDAEVERETVPVDELVTRFPEFARPHWEDCTATVRR
jgi:hypothetical protein